MDTPEKTTQIANPLSKFEDSPVFNYINNLSPIKPVKSRHITQTFNSLNFASLPSIFTSPHVSSLKETRFLQRNNSPDPSRPVISSSDSGNKAITTNGIAENLDTGVASEDVSADPSDDSKFSVELPQTLTYDCASPSCNHMPSCGIKPNCAPEMEDTTLSVMLYDSSEGEMHLPVRKETDAYDWESLISDAADLLIFNYPHHEPRIQMLKSGNFSQQHEMEDLSVQTRGNGDLPETDQLQDNSAADDLDKCVTADSNQKGDDEPVYNLHRGMRRRCLDFEMVARRKNLDNGSNSNSHMILQSEEKTTSESMHLVTHKPSSDSTRRILPGIGLHLNALAMASQDNKLVNSTASIHSQESQQTGPDSLHESLTSDSAAERDMVLVENGNPLVDDFPQTSPTLVGEELNQSSPKKKRRKAENAGESEGCKRCNCKKSKCLKLYCECFAAGVYCIEPCSCQDCFNKPIHEDTVLATRKQIESRNPLAFAPKVIRSNNTVPEFGDDSAKTPASARHKRGCNCKKSSCLKKYCECYQGGVGCSINCRCEGCKNAFGRKDGSTPIETEARPGVGEEEAMEIHEKCEVDINVQKTEILSNEESNPAVTVTATPLRVCRSLYQLPFSSKGKPPRTVLTIGSSSAFYTGQKYGKPNILRSQHNFVKSFKKSQEDEMPEILQGQGSPLKSVSPNNKRISPPNGVLCSGSGSGSGIGSSPSRRNGRKLILQSIPSFPSLTPHH